MFDDMISVFTSVVTIAKPKVNSNLYQIIGTPRAAKVFTITIDNCSFSLFIRYSPNRVYHGNTLAMLTYDFSNIIDRRSIVSSYVRQVYFSHKGIEYNINVDDYVNKDNDKLTARIGEVFKLIGLEEKDIKRIALWSNKWLIASV